MVKDSETGDFGNYGFSRKTPNFESFSPLKVTIDKIELPSFIIRVVLTYGHTD